MSVDSSNSTSICPSSSSSNSPSNSQFISCTAVSMFDQFYLDRSHKLLVKKLSENATIPTKEYDKAAGFDLYSAEDCVIPAACMGYQFCHETKVTNLVKTDLSIRVPDGTYGRIAPRSGLAVKNKITTGAGVIDQSYTGNVGVVLFNFGNDDFSVKKGDRIAQLILEKISYERLEVVDELPNTERGEKGFGSSGV